MPVGGRLALGMPYRRIVELFGEPNRTEGAWMVYEWDREIAGARPFDVTERLYCKIVSGRSGAWRMIYFKTF